MVGVAHEERSKALFGNKDMLALCGAIARSGDRFTAQELATETGLAYSTIHRLLRSLATAGLLEVEPRVPRDRGQPYLRHRHKFWEAASDLLSGGRA